jgi:hypothetical protein
MNEKKSFSIDQTSLLCQLVGNRLRDPSNLTPTKGILAKRAWEAIHADFNRTYSGYSKKSLKTRWERLKASYKALLAVRHPGPLDDSTPSRPSVTPSHDGDQVGERVDRVDRVLMEEEDGDVDVDVVDVGDGGVERVEKAIVTCMAEEDMADAAERAVNQAVNASTNGDVSGSDILPSIEAIQSKREKLEKMSKLVMQSGCLDEIERILDGSVLPADLMPSLSSSSPSLLHPLHPLYPLHSLHPFHQHHQRHSQELTSAHQRSPMFARFHQHHHLPTDIPSALYGIERAIRDLTDAMRGILERIAVILQNKKTQWN